MISKSLLFLILAIVSVLFLPIELFASTTDFGGADFATQTTKIQNFLFGPVAKIVGIFGLGFGIFQGILTGSVKPFLVGGAICLGICVVPSFINSVFVSGMLLP